MRSRQQDVGSDEGAATNESLIGLAGEGQFPEQRAHVGPLAKLRGRGLRVVDDSVVDAIATDAVAIALSAPLERLLSMITVRVGMDKATLYKPKQLLGCVIKTGTHATFDHVFVWPAE